MTLRMKKNKQKYRQFQHKLKKICLVAKKIQVICRHKNQNKANI